jgi:hypothetical protein
MGVNSACSQDSREPKPILPDLLFTTESAFGGWGLLKYSNHKKKYSLFDGKINTYVFDQNSLRLMMPDEGGGTMANPEHLAMLGKSVFGTSFYGRVNQLDPSSGEINHHYAFATLAFGGSGSQPKLFSWKDHLLLVTRDKAITLDSALKPLSSRVLELRFLDRSTLLQDKGAIYSIETDNPNTYSNCAGGCNFPVVIRQTKIDFSDPLKIEINSKERKLESDFGILHRTRVGERGWLLTKYSSAEKETTIEFHPSERLEHASLEYKLPYGGSVIATTSSEPAFAIIRSANGSLHLGKILVGDEKIDLRLTPLKWAKPGMSRFELMLTQDKSLLFIGIRQHLAVYRIDGPKPERLLHQVFAFKTGNSQFQINKLFVSNLKVALPALNRERLESLLQKSFWEERDLLALNAEVEKLSANDEWVIPAFVKLLKERQSSPGVMLYSLEALSRFGSKAKAAIPQLLEKNIGSSYSEPQRSQAFKLIKKIDPNGKETLPQVTEFLNDAFKVRSTVELLEFIGCPKCKELAGSTRKKWKF